jgi:hypothetical protein
MSQVEETSLTLEEIKEAAELFKLLFKLQQEAVSKTDHPEKFIDVS